MSKLLYLTFSVSFLIQITDLTTVQALSGDTATGAMTYSFIQAAQNEPGLTYGRLLNAMHQTIRDTNTGFLPNGPVTSLLRKVTRQKLTQVICSNPAQII